MKPIYILSAILILASSASAQNCTTTPAMNRVNIASGNSVIGNASTGTIEVLLASPFTSQTGYMQIYAAGTSWPSGPSSGYSGSYPIVSGNNSMDVTVKAVSVANPGGFATTFTGQALITGSTTGATVSDLKVVKVSARKYTLEWSTPGYNSTTNVSYGSDLDTLGLPGGFGYNWPSKDTTTGVSYHSITIDNLIPGGAANSNNGVAPFTVWSECFNTDGSVNKLLYASLPGGNPYSAQVIVTAPIDVMAGQNTYTMSPIGLTQDGIHNGFRAVPGGNVIIPLTWNDTTVPSSGYTHFMQVAVTDWNTGVGLLTNFGASGQYYRSATLNTWGSNGNFVVTQDNNYSGNLYMHIGAGAATSGTACTTAGGTNITVDGSTPACAYPLKISATPWGGTSCSTIVCGPPGTTGTSQPYVSEIWIIVYNVPAVPRNPVGAWINPNTMMPGIPCEREANKMIDNCLNLSAGLGGIYNNYFSYEGGQDTNCTWNATVQPIWVNINTSNWFYDGGYVCHTLDLLGYPKPGGGNRDKEEHHILGAELDYWYPRRVDYALFASFLVSAPATILNNPTCTAIAPSAFWQQCSGMQLSVGTQDVTPIANALAAGTVLRACFNIPTNTVNRPYYTGAATAASNPCQVLPRPPTPTLTLLPGGSLPASTSYSLGQYYVGANGILSYYSGPASIITDSTCPTSGRCSIDVSSLPAVANATGWCVYANFSGQSYYQYCSPTSPLTIGADLVLDGPVGAGSGNPFQNTSIASVTTWGTSGMYITAADIVNHTITVDSQLDASQPTVTGYAPSQPTTGSTIIVVRAGGMIADAASSTTQIVCASCNFANVTANSADPVNQADTAYCGVVAGDLGEPIYTTAPNRGSQIVSKTATTLNLSTPINCGSGVPFEVRFRQGHGGASRIFMWTNGLYDVFERQHNYIAADAIVWLGSNTGPTGSGGAPWSPAFESYIGLRREDALTMRACQLTLHIISETGGAGNTPFNPSPMCTYPQLNPDFWPQNAFQRIDTLVNNGEGNGSGAGSFLNGLTAFSIVQWWLDPLMNAQNDPRFVYWVKKLADYMWTYYGAANARSTPSACNSSYPHEWAYLPDSPRLGISCLVGYNASNSVTIMGNQTWSYWSIYGNLIPAYAFLYWYTGNAQIPTVNAINPNFTYGQAYADMTSWIFIYMANQTFLSGPAADKTLGEMGVWQYQALGSTGWMSGNTVTTSSLTITSTSLPVGMAGTAYTASVGASGGTPPYTWTSVGLPAGLTMTSGGNISGTPTAAGSTTPTFTVTDSTTPTAMTASANIPLTVNAAPPPPPAPGFTPPIISKRLGGSDRIGLSN